MRDELDPARALGWGLTQPLEVLRRQGVCKWVSADGLNPLGIAAVEDTDVWLRRRVMQLEAVGRRVVLQATPGHSTGEGPEKCDISACTGGATNSASCKWTRSSCFPALASAFFRSAASRSRLVCASVALCAMCVSE